MDDVSALVVGPHDERLVCPAGYTRVSGVPVTQLMEEDHFGGLVQEVIHAGDFIVEMAGRSTAYYGPSAAVAEMVYSIVRNTRRVLCVSLVLQGELGVDGAALSVPARIGKGGVQRVLIPELGAADQGRLQKAGREMKTTLEGVVS
jgi:malate dehydrogenase